MVNSKQNSVQAFAGIMEWLYLTRLQVTALLSLFFLLPHAAFADNPQPGWRDSYSVNGQCYCDSTFDHGLRDKQVSTPHGTRTVFEVCAVIGSGPGVGDNPVYNDIQCGNGPPNDAGDEVSCPGRVDLGSSGCQITGPTWNLDLFFRTTDSPLETETETETETSSVAEPNSTIESATEQTAAPTLEPLTSNLVPSLPDIPDQTIMAGDTLSLLVNAADPEGFAPSLYLSQAPDGVFFNDNGDGSRTLSWQSSEFDVGQHELIIVAKDALDDLLITEKLIRIDVLMPLSSTTDNSTPFINFIDTTTVNIGQSINVLVSPIDPDGIVPGVYLENPPVGSLFVDNLNGTRTLRWTPQSESAGIHEIRAVAEDAVDTTLTSTTAFTIIVLSDTQPSNNAIYFSDIAAQSIVPDQTLEFIVEAIDPDGTIPWLQVINPPIGASFHDNLNGARTFSWTPAAGDIGTRDIRFIALDSQQQEIAVELVVPVTILEPE